MFDDLPVQKRRESQVVLAIVALLVLANAVAGFAMLRTASGAATLLLACSVALAFLGARLAVQAWRS